MKMDERNERKGCQKGSMLNWNLTERRGWNGLHFEHCSVERQAGLNTTAHAEIGGEGINIIKSIPTAWWLFGEPKNLNFFNWN
jgi:hypothetical protein